MKISFVKRKKAFALVSMADIAFLLLIFLVVTVTVGEPDSVTVPEFLYARKTGFSYVIPVELKVNGDVSVNGAAIPGGGTDAGRSALLRSFEELSRTVRGDGELVIRFAADRNAPYEQVDFMLEALREAGLTRVVLAAEQKESGHADGN